MIKIKKIDHVAIAVPSIDEALAKYQQALGLTVREREVVGSQRVEAALLPVGETSIELIEPKGNEALARYLEKKGPGLHHIAVEVEGIEDALAFLKAAGVPLVDETPRTGARGHKVAFLHPKATGGVLIELVEPTAEHSS
jgi:methylmalonyl-CoA/ethylmalonyl-CoA epimerase